MRVGLVAALAVAVLAGTAEAHGPHHGPIRPAYDCFWSPDGPDTRGDVDLIYDEYVDAWHVWKCQCEYTYAGYYLCWWRLRGVYRDKDAAVRRMKELARPDARYFAPVRKLIRVSWQAQHADGACYTHYKSHWARVVRMKG